MAGYPPEKQSPIQRFSHEGLELDTRAGDGFEKHLDHSKPLPDLRKWHQEEENDRYLNEKQMIQAHEVPQSSPTSPESSMGMMSPQTPQVKMMDDSMGSPPAPRTRTICGLRRSIFWLLFAIVSALVIVAAVVGGVLGGTKRNNGAGKGTPSPSAAAGNAPAQPGDVVAGSPLNVISYIGNATNTGSKADRQVFRVYYQSVLGNVKEAVSNGSAGWAGARPIFTDAINNTGLATVTYMNDTAPMGQIFYISGINGFMQEKRKNFNYPDSNWEPGPSLGINSLNILVIGKVSVAKSDQSPQDPKNDWDGYRMAAVYSDHFAAGAGTRLFCHQTGSNGTNWVQEYIWTRSSETWRAGQAIRNVSPNSHIAATVDDKNNLLRLYFSSGSLTLQEMWLNISDTNALYNNGVSVSNFLPQNDVELAATSDNGTVYLYHPSNVGKLGIRELIISGVPGPIMANSPQESYNLSEALAAEPQVASSDGPSSPYQPLAVGITKVEDAPYPSIWLWWADHVTGSNPGKNGSVTGYNTLQAKGKPVFNATWDTTTPVLVSLGSSNSYPSSSKFRRWSRSWLR
ncbi:MAG: hypothetical protein LQ350_001280 [Teloschistes chrysophthalmus]|nr:MAG: hypothetical protein LQ350_001280 [Niorma chrysophthalma]